MTAGPHFTFRNSEDRGQVGPPVTPETGLMGRTVRRESRPQEWVRLVSAEPQRVPLTSHGMAEGLARDLGCSGRREAVLLKD